MLCLGQMSDFRGIWEYLAVCLRVVVAGKNPAFDFMIAV